MEVDSSFLTTVMFLLVGRTWEDQVSNPLVGSNNFLLGRPNGWDRDEKIKTSEITSR